MIEKGIRGGICHSMHRYAKANNKHLKDYDEKKESSFLTYTDSNNLYENAMIRKLPDSNYQWVQDLSKIDEEFIENYYDDSIVGCFIEAGIEYPKELHSLNSDLPFLPERMEVNGCN